MQLKRVNIPSNLLDSQFRYSSLMVVLQIILAFGLEAVQQAEYSTILFLIRIVRLVWYSLTIEVPFTHAPKQFENQKKSFASRAGINIIIRLPQCNYTPCLEANLLDFFTDNFT